MTAAVHSYETMNAQWQKALPPEIKRLLQEKDKIVFSPDQYSSFLPLEAIQIGGQPLCLEKPVARCSSCSQLITVLNRTPQFDSSLIMGNPWPEHSKKELIYSQDDSSEKIRISFLEGAKKEAKTLKKYLPRSIALLGEKATGHAFLSKISNHSLIHFSGHGILGKILLFSGSRTISSPLELEELFLFQTLKRRGDIPMTYDWYPVTSLDLFDVSLNEGAIVFLNACQTGRHTYMGGGYFQGLSSICVKNGAASVISSLVPIFDEPSKEFALQFYEVLFKTKSVALALKKARIYSKEKYSAHIYWVPHIHYGSPF
jgi:CHAT domain-containing protein